MGNENAPELNGKYLGTITKDFVKVCDTLKVAAYQLKARKISEFPIFPIAKKDIAIGQNLIPKGQKENDLCMIGCQTMLKQICFDLWAKSLLDVSWGKLLL